MSKVRLHIALVALLLAASFAYGEVKNEQWRATMHELAETLNALLPALVSDRPNKDIVRKYAKRLSELSHSLPPGLQTGAVRPVDDIDPSIGIIAGRFSDDAMVAYQAIAYGNLDYGIARLRTVASFCMACHTRHGAPDAAPKLSLDLNTGALPGRASADLLIATRQFDRGLNMLLKLIKDDKFAEAQPFNWERCVRQAISITVRVKDDPQLTDGIINTALASPSILEDMRSTLLVWSTAVKDWALTRGEGRVSPAEKMRALMREAKGLQTFGADHTADIQLLRAQRVAHEILRTTTDQRLRAEALYTLGVSADAMNTSQIGEIKDLYYSACIRAWPKSSQAAQCYKRYEQSIYAGFSGSSGTHIPNDVRANLLQLKDQAAP